MWGLTPARVGILAAAALSAFVAGLAVCWFGLASPRIEAVEQKARGDVAALMVEYQRGRAEGERAGREAQERQNLKALEASDERSRELARLANLAAARPPAVVRVCPPGASPAAAPGGGQAGPAPGDGPAGGVLPDATGDDPGAVLAARLRGLALEADAVNADLRAVVAACSP